MTSNAQKIKVIVKNNGIEMSEAQAEFIAARMVEEGIRITFLTILGVIAVLWLTS